MILIDAGPMVALVDADDQHHRSCAAALQTLREPLGTVWPALTEAMYLLAGLGPGQNGLWEMIERGAIQLLALGSTDLPRIRQLMRKYANRRMDLADAALLHVAEREGIRTFFTIDRRDFRVYRLHGRVRPVVIP
jgi:predicted nucleic acid-binding protein